MFRRPGRASGARNLLLKVRCLPLLTSRPVAFRLRLASVAKRAIHSTALRAKPLKNNQDDFTNHSLAFMSGPSRTDTIYALSTAQGKAGIAVIRISGPACLDVYKRICPQKPLPKPRYAAVRTLRDPGQPDNAPVLDSEAVVLYFPATKTVTGEDILELHVHGGSATVKAVLRAIPRCETPAKTSSLRYAEPGEFTKRAFLNDRLDLSQVEALSDVLDAETEQQRRAAVRGNSGIRGQIYDTWRNDLLLARGEIEALIDFSEDQHFDESPRELLHNVTSMVQQILRSIDQHELAGQRTELLRTGIRIALLGPPNVGKSSLMNLIVGREASIVSREAGTTRDIVEASLDIGGYLCTFADTAGIRTQALVSDGAIGPIEEEGIRRARLKASSSDVIIVLASIEKDQNGQTFLSYDQETLRLAARAEQRIVVVNKCDSTDRPELELLLKNFKLASSKEFPVPPELITISCKEAEAPPASSERDPGGISCLTKQLIGSFESLTSLPDDMQGLIGGTERQRQLLSKCRVHLEDFIAEAAGEQPEDQHPDQEPDIVLAAEHLRYAADCLAQITGRGGVGDVEEVLGVIFEKY